jgi:hypothetical protein
MLILWGKNRVVEQHLEGDCRDVEKLKIEVHDFFGERLLRVQQVDSMSDGVLKIYVDISKES